MSQENALYENGNNILANADKLASKGLETTNAYMQKFYDMSSSIELKYDYMQETKSHKEMDLKGYRQGYLVFPDYVGDRHVDHDGDSGAIQDAESGEIFEYRSNAYNEFDTVDYYKDVYNTPYKRKLKVQPRMVAELNNKRIDELNEEDYRNVERYNFLQTLQTLTNPQVPFERYDPAKRYDTPPDLADRKIPIYYKATGVDVFNRYLTDIVEPTTKKSVFNMETDNPYMNARFGRDRYGNFSLNMIGDEALEREEQFRNTPTISVKNTNTLSKYGIDYNSLLNSYGTNSDVVGSITDYLGYAIDSGTSGFLDFWGRMLRNYAPEFTFDRKWWEKMSKEDSYGVTGFERMVGMNTKQKAIFRKAMLSNNQLGDSIYEDLRNGNTQKAISNIPRWIGQGLSFLPVLLSQSSSQMIPAMTVGAISGSLTGGIGAVLASTMVVAADNTAAAMDDYRKNNNGKEMSKEDFAKTFSLNLVAGGADSILAFTGASMFFKGGKLGKVLSKGAYKPIIQNPPSIVKGTLGGAGAETLQEGFENAIQEYFGQSEENKKSFADIATSSDVVQGALYGGLMGGFLGGGSTHVANIKTYNRNLDIKQALDAHEEKINNTTPNNWKATEQDKEAAAATIEQVNQIAATPNPTSYNPATDNVQEIFRNEVDRTKQLRDLQNQARTQKAWNVATRELSETIHRTVQRIDSNSSLSEEDKKLELAAYLKATGLTPEEAFRKIVYHNSPQALIQEGKTITSEQRKANEEEFRRLGKSFGLSRDQIEKNLEQTHLDLYEGLEGITIGLEIAQYYTKQIETIAADPNLNEDQKKNFIAEAQQWRLGGLSRIYRAIAHNASKLKKMTEAAEYLGKNPNDMRSPTIPWLSGEGKGAYATRKDLTRGEDSGFFKQYNLITSEITEMQQLLQENSSQEDIAVIAEDHSKYYQNQPELQIKDPYTEITNRISESKERLNSAIDRMIKTESSNMVDVTDDLVSKPEMLDRLVRSLTAFKDNKNKKERYEDGLNQLKEVYNKEPEIWKQMTNRIKNSNINPKLQEKINGVFDSVVALAKKHQNISDQAEETNKKNVASINRGSKRYTEKVVNDFINSFPTDLLNIPALKKAELNSLHKGLKRLKGIVERTLIDKNDTELLDKAKKLQELFQKLDSFKAKIKTEKAKKAEEAKKAEAKKETEKLNDTQEAQSATQDTNQPKSDSNNQQNQKPAATSEEEALAAMASMQSEDDFNNESFSEFYDEDYSTPTDKRTQETIISDDDIPIDLLDDSISPEEDERRNFTENVNLENTIKQKMNYVANWIKSATNEDRLNSERKSLERLIERIRNQKKQRPEYEKSIKDIKNLIKQIDYRILAITEKGISNKKNKRNCSVNRMLANPAVSFHNGKAIVFSNDEIKECKDKFPIINKDGEIEFYTRDQMTPSLWGNITARIKSFWNQIKVNPDKATSSLAYNANEFGDMIVDNKLLGFIDNKNFTFNPNGTIAENLQELLKYSTQYINDYFYSYNNTSKDSIESRTTTLPNGKKVLLSGNSLPLAKDSSKILTAKLQDNPALALFYDFPVDENGKALIGYDYRDHKGEIKYQQEAILIALYTLMQYSSQNDLSKYFEKGAELDTNTAARLFGKNPKQLRNGQAEGRDYIFTVQNFGIPYNQIANDLGSLFVKNAGIGCNNGLAKTAGWYEGLQSCIGDEVIKIARAMGVFQVKELTKENWKKAYADSTGLEKDSPIETDKMYTIFIDKSKTDQFKSMRDFHRDVLQDLFSTSNSKLYEPNWNARKHTKGERRTVSKTDGMYIVPDDMQEAMEEAENTAHTVNMPLMSILDMLVDGDPDNTYLDLFFKNNFDLLTEAEKNGAFFDDLQSDDGKSMTIEQAKESLLRVYRMLLERDPNKRQFYFDYKIVSNMRYMIDCGWLNPQSNTVHRWFIPQVGFYQEYDPSNDEDIKWIIYATSQAFDKLDASFNEQRAIYEFLTSLSANDIKQLMRDICTKGADEALAMEKYQYTYTDENGEIHSESLGVENIAQVMHVLTHYVAQNSANGGKFKSYLATENDATTSGYSIKFLNMPLSNLYTDMNGNDLTGRDNILEKVGILVGNRAFENSNISMHELKELKKNGKKEFLDIYQTSGEYLYKKLSEGTLADTSDLDVLEDYFDKRINLEVFTGAKEHAEFYKAMKDALPVAELGEDGNWTVSKALRQLLKPAVMTFGYTAGLHGISVNLSEDLFNNTYKKYYNKWRKSGKNLKDFAINEYAKAAKTKSDEEAINQMTAIKNTFDFLQKHLVNDKRDIFEVLKNKSDSVIKVRLDGHEMSLFDAFESVIEHSYGQAAWDGLSTIFEPYKIINDSMNEMAAIQFTNFKEEYDRGIEKLAEKWSWKVKKRGSNELTRVWDLPYFAKKELLDRLKELYPGIQLAYSNEKPVEGNLVRLMNMERDTSPNSIYQKNSFDIPVTPNELVAKVTREENGIGIADNFHVGRILRPEVFAFTTPRKKGAVLSVHGTDGCQQTKNMLAAKTAGITMLGVHDAIICSAKHAHFLSKRANYAANEVNRNWSMYEKSLEAVVDSCLLRHLVISDLSVEALHSKGFLHKLFDIANGLDHIVNPNLVKPRFTTPQNFDSFTPDVIRSFIKNGSLDDKFIFLDALITALKGYITQVERSNRNEYNRRNKILHLEYDFVKSKDPNKKYDTIELMNYTTIYGVEPHTKKLNRYGKLKPANRTNLENELINAYNILTKGMDIKTPNFKRVLPSIREMRKAFYERDFITYNTDGNSGTGAWNRASESPATTMLNDPDMAPMFKNTKIRGSTPKGFTSLGNRQVLLSRANKEAGARVDILDALRDMAANNNSVQSTEAEHKIYTSLISLGDPKVLSDLEVTLEAATMNVGEYNSLSRTIRLGYEKTDSTSKLFDKTRRMCVYTDTSYEANYTHEVIHACMGFANEHKNDLKLRDTFMKIRDLQKYVLDNDILTWQDFMPEDGTYDPSAKHVYEDAAKDLIDYIYDNKNTRSDEALNEFIAVCLTHPKAMAKLQQAKNMLNTNKTTLDLLVDLVKAVLKALFKPNESFRDISKPLDNLINRKNFKKNLTLYDDLKELTTKLMQADIKADATLSSHVANNLNIVFDKIQTIKEIANDWTTHTAGFFFNFAKEFKQPETNMEKFRSKLHRKLWRLMQMNGQASNPFTGMLKMARMISASMVSKMGREALKVWFSDINRFSQQGAFNCIIRDVSTPDDPSKFFEMTSLYTRAIDASSMGIAATVREELESNFTDYDKKSEVQRSLTYGGFMTDGQSLMNDNFSNIKEYKEFLRSNDKCRQAIEEKSSRLAEILHTKGTDNTAKEMLNWILNQARSLGKFQVTGIGNENLNLNANNIAMLNYQPMNTFKYRLDDNPEAVKLIDQIASLHAIMFLDQNTRDLCASMSDKGLSSALRQHRTFVKESAEGVKVTDIHGNDIVYNIFQSQECGVGKSKVSNMQKGYVKHITNSDIERKIAIRGSALAKDLERQGFKAVSTPSDKNLNNQIVNYIRITYSPKHSRDSVSYVMKSSQRMGTSFTETLESINANTKSGMEDLINKSHKRAKSIDWIMRNRKPSEETDRLIEKISNSAVPVARNSYYVYDEANDKMTVNNSPLDFRYMGTHEFHEKRLDMEIEATMVLSKMFASLNTKAMSYHMNNALANFLIKYQNDNMDRQSKTVIETITPYNANTSHKKKPIKMLRLSPDSNNEFIKKAWPTLPKQLVDIIKENDLHIREDWLVQFFGVPNYSVGYTIEEKLPDSVPGKHNLKRTAQLFELFLKAIGAQYKKITVIGKPVVWLSNLISNFNHTLMYFSNPIEIFRLQIANFKATADYLNTRRELDKIMYRVRTGTATAKEKMSINWYKAKLQNNAVAPLMEAGMYQNIIEDVRASDLDETGRVYKSLKKMGIISKIEQLPKWIKAPSGFLFRNLTLANSSGIYRAMYGITQYSDFVARATEYQLMMNNKAKVPVRDEHGKIMKDANGKDITRAVVPDKYDDQGRVRAEWLDYEQRVKYHVLSTFINYDKPQSTPEQYLNDMGLIMFIKFFKRIQNVIYRDMLKNPIGCLMMLFSHSMFMDTEDILEQNVLSKHCGSLVHNPMDSAYTAFMPWAYQVYSGEIDMTPKLTKN